MQVHALYSPYAPALHPQHVRINQRTAQWAVRHRIGSAELRSALVESDIGTFAARILPEGREDVAQLLADFVLWLFGVDDGHCEDGQLGRRPGALAAELSRLLRVAQNPEAPLLPTDRLAAGLRDLSRRFTALGGTPAQKARWVDALREYYLSVVWEAEHRVAGTVPTLSDYTLMRLYDGATSVVLPLLELGHGYELDPDERDDRQVRALAEMAYFVICWDNDLFSYDKEARSGHWVLNVITVLQHHQGCTVEQALALAVEQRDRVLYLFARCAEAVRRTASPQLLQYLDSLADFVRGAQDWGVTSARYALGRPRSRSRPGWSGRRWSRWTSHRWRGGGSWWTNSAWRGPRCSR
ncbi:selina-4(15),7(11)-diene synthase [Streptacidiphilus monticola]